MNTLQQIGLALVLLLAVIGGSFYGGIKYQQAKQTEIDLLIEKSVDKAAESAAKAIAGIEIKQTTINNKVKEIVRTETVYSECKHTPEAYQKIKEKFND